jgi:hypothetical protein
MELERPSRKLEELQASDETSCCLIGSANSWLIAAAIAKNLCCSLLVCKRRRTTICYKQFLPWKLQLLLIFKDLEKACVHYFFNQRAPNSQLDCS